MNRGASVEVPEGVRALLRPEQVTKALNIDYSTVKQWLDKGKLPSLQDKRHEMRRVKTADLIQFAEERGLDLDLEKTL
jgi:excisionase family DNA binding protein